MNLYSEPVIRSRKPRFENTWYWRYLRWDSGKETVLNNVVAFYTNKKVVFLLATLCCLLWGSSYPAIKNGYALFHIADGDIPGKLLFAGYRFAIAGMVLLLLAKVRGNSLTQLKPDQPKQLVILGLSQTVVQYTLFYIGLAHTTGVNGSIMNATQTFFSVLLAAGTLFIQ